MKKYTILFLFASLAAGGQFVHPQFLTVLAVLVAGICILGVLSLFGVNHISAEEFEKANAGSDLAMGARFILAFLIVGFYTHPVLSFSYLVIGGLFTILYIANRREALEQ